MPAQDLNVLLGLHHRARRGPRLGATERRRDPGEFAPDFLEAPLSLDAATISLSGMELIGSGTEISRLEPHLNLGCLKVRLGLTALGVVNIRCRVVHIERYDERYRVGVHFRHFAGDDHQKLERFIAQFAAELKASPNPG